MRSMQTLLVLAYVFQTILTSAAIAFDLISEIPFSFAKQTFMDYCKVA